MAEFTLPPGTNATIYDNITGAFIGVQNLAPGGFLTDSNAGDTSFVFGESLLFSIGANPPVGATYSGVATALNNPAFVISTTGPNPILYVLNRSLDGTTFPTIASLGLNNGIDWTGLVCFAAGTRIATPQGGVAVETLAIGQIVLTADGRAVPVRWIGQQTVMPIFSPPERAQLVRISAGALGAGLPERDLVVTADHALCLDGMLVNAGALVGGVGIAAVPHGAFGESYTVYHVETEEQDLILAEGVPAETFVDGEMRRRFDNAAEYDALYPDAAPTQAPDLPRIATARLLPPGLRARIGLTRSA